VTNVVLVCVAGISGTFLARRVRQLDSGFETTVSTLDALPAVAASADAILIAPQLAASLETITALAGRVPVAVLPGTAYSADGADIAVRTLHALLGPESPNFPHPTSGKKD